MTTTTKPTLDARLRKLGACEEAREWANGKTAPEAWRACERGDWLLWLCGRLSGRRESAARKKLVLCAMECARLSLPIFEKQYPNDNRVRKCIETAERWARGEATMSELRDARAAYAAATADAAYAADAAAYSADAAYAAAAAAVYAAAYAAYAAVYSADDAAYAATAAAYAADAATYAAAAADAATYAAAAADGQRVLKECADIVRKHYARPPRVKGATR